MPRTNAFSLVWGCTEVNLICSHPQRVHNVGTSKKPSAIHEMDLLGFWIHKYLLNTYYVPLFRVGAGDRTVEKETEIPVLTGITFKLEEAQE